jgi:hypothetical protein
VISIVLYHLFDDCDKEWKSEECMRTKWEILGWNLGIIGSVAFWTTEITREWAPIFPIAKIS